MQEFADGNAVLWRIHRLRSFWALPAGVRQAPPALTALTCETECGVQFCRKKPNLKLLTEWSVAARRNAGYSTAVLSEGTARDARASLSFSLYRGKLARKTFVYQRIKDERPSVCLPRRFDTRGGWPVIACARFARAGRILAWLPIENRSGRCTATIEMRPSTRCAVHASAKRGPVASPTLESVFFRPARFLWR